MTAAHFLRCSADVLADMQADARRQQALRDIEICRKHELPLDLQGARHCRVGIEDELKLRGKP